MAPLLWTLTISFILAACHTRITIEKRHYRKGFYISAGKNHFAQNKNIINDSLPETSVAGTAKKNINIRGTSASSVSTAKKENTQGNNSAYEVVKNKNKTTTYVKAEKKTAVSHVPEVAKTNYTSHRPDQFRRSEKQTNKYEFAIMVALMFPLMWPLMRRMRSHSWMQLSQWYKANAKTARWHIVGFHLMIFFASAAIGTFFQKSGTVQKGDMGFFITSVFGGLAMLYYSVKQFIKDKAKKFTFKKIMTVLGALFPALGIIFMVAHSGHAATSETEPYTTGQVVGRVFLLILLIALLVLAFMGLATAACELSCSGYEALAVLVFFGGGYIASFLFLLAAIHLFKKRFKTAEEKQKQNKKITITALINAAIIVLVLTLVMFAG